MDGTWNEKKCEDKDLIWRMVGEMVKKQGKARLYISCDYSCTVYFLVKILLVKLRNFHTLVCKGCKDGGIYQNIWPIP